MPSDMIIYNTETPILFLIFNRPTTTSLVFEKIRKAKPKKFYIAADGPRDSNEKSSCEKTRKIALDIDWECDIQTLFKEKNVGCKEAISTALQWFFSLESEGIILEDDCLPADSFFGFCSALLELYRFDTRIAHIAGINFQNGVVRGDGSYYFSKLTHVWGWAGWRRAFQDYDPSIKTFPTFQKQGLIMNIPSLAPFATQWLQNFESVHNGRVDTWDYQYAYLNLINNALCIIPNKNLVSNIGVGNDATHTQTHPFQNLPLEEMDEITHPTFFIEEVDADIYAHMREYGIHKRRKNPSFLSKLFNR